mgnify:FL=1
MGVPAFFRWLTNKYSDTLQDCVEEEGEVDTTEPNPNQQEFDNLYLDMNGIIHPCCHPQDEEAPETEEDMMVAIFKYIDRIFSIIRPRKLLYMAIDGVAPRAKMNQQRSRRFRAAKDARESMEKKEAVKEQLRREGHPIPRTDPVKGWDSNVITPGTPFMDKVARSVRFYVQKKISSDPGWKNIKVIFSDANTPGEGEHKIVKFIREMRTREHYDPNTSHVLYGLDADLIMLALATHEPHFTILRERVFAPREEHNAQRDLTELQDQIEEFQIAGLSIPAELEERKSSLRDRIPVGKKPFQLLSIPVLREYLAAELKCLDKTLRMEWDLERLIDDFVFLCFFVGNDFLPHLPSLDIRDGAIDTLLDIYKKLLPTFDGYVTKNGEVNVVLAERLMAEVGALEEEIFQKKRAREQRMKERQARQDAEKQYRKTSLRQRAEHETSRSRASNSSEGNNKRLASDMDDEEVVTIGLGSGNLKQDFKEANKLAAAKLRQEMALSSTAYQRNIEQQQESNTADDSPAMKRAKILLQGKTTPVTTLTEADKSQVLQTVQPSLFSPTDSGEDSEPAFSEEVTSLTLKHKIKETMREANDVEHVVGDNVRFGEPGWRERYYKVKFSVDINNPEEWEPFQKKIAKSYLEGLVWVLRYYYQGCCSWEWFYPFYHAPLAEQVVGVGEFFPDGIHWEDPGKPFAPFEQLMGVFPADSSHAIPNTYRWLMTSPESPILEYYPRDFEVDFQGVKWAWQGVSMLPFIDQHKLLAAMRQAEALEPLTAEEEERNALGVDLMIVHEEHQLSTQIQDLYKDGDSVQEVIMDPLLSPSITGFLRPSQRNVVIGGVVRSPLPQGLARDFSPNKAYTVEYSLPASQPHLTQLLPGVILPPPRIRSDWVPNNQGHFQPQRGGGGRGRGRGGYNGYDNRGPFQSGGPRGVVDMYVDTQAAGRMIQYHTQQQHPSYHQPPPAERFVHQRPGSSSRGGGAPPYGSQHHYGHPPPEPYGGRSYGSYAAPHHHNHSQNQYGGSSYSAGGRGGGSYYGSYLSGAVPPAPPPPPLAPSSSTTTSYGYESQYNRSAPPRAPVVPPPPAPPYAAGPPSSSSSYRGAAPPAPPFPYASQFNTQTLPPQSQAAPSYGFATPPPSYRHASSNSSHNAFGALQQAAASGMASSSVAAAPSSRRPTAGKSAPSHAQPRSGPSQYRRR